MSKTLPNTKIEPLVNDLKKLNIGYYLISNYFKKYCVKAGIDELWGEVFSEAENNRNYYSVGFNHEPHDAEDALVILLNHYYSTNKSNLFIFIENTLHNYCEFNKCSIDTSGFIESLELIDAPQEILNSIRTINQNNSQAVPIVDFLDISTFEKLDNYLKKMDVLIEQKEYEQVLTYSYSSLEGLFKSYIKENIPDKISIEKLNQQAVCVRDDIKRKLENDNIIYPEPMLTLISTITSAISNARNSHSTSHFDADSYDWLAIYTRDCVNTIGRLVMRFINRKPNEL